MKLRSIAPLSSVKGELKLPGDKSIAHRAIILSALASGKTRIKNIPLNKDCLSTVEAFKKLGIKIKRSRDGSFIIFGRGLSGLRKPARPIFCGESGTTMRLLSGLLSAQDFDSVLGAAGSLSKRPMSRVTLPLRRMGADITGRRKQGEEYPPLNIRGRGLKGISYQPPVASAQVKSAILLAGLYAAGKTSVKEKIATRDHTERMLKAFKADIKVAKNTIVMKSRRELASPKNIYIPSDISSASFFILLASLLPGSALRIKNVSLNPSRSGLIRVLKRMGARIKVLSRKGLVLSAGEPAGDLLVKGSQLKAVNVKREEVPSLIDELPVLMLAASLSRGRSVFHGVQELRIKETDRIKSVSVNLKNMGVEIRSVRSGRNEDVIIKGAKTLKAASLKSFGDHRTAMTMAIAALLSAGKSRIDDTSCIDKSFPEFLSVLRTLK